MYVEAPVPENTTLLMMGIGLALLATASIVRRTVPEL